MKKKERKKVARGGNILRPCGLGWLGSWHAVLSKTIADEITSPD